MKLLISAIITFTLLFTACENVNEPVTNSTELNTQFDSPNYKTAEDFNISIIPLPEKSPIYLDSIFTVTKLINGLLGGTITLDKVYISKEGKLVTMLVDMVIPPLAFIGQREITVTIEDSIAVMNCGPGMNFRRPLIVVQTFTGLDLMNYNTKDIDFGYIKDDGQFYAVPRLALIINKPLGLVSIVGAKISHFSKYGWVRKHNNSN
jgi:archaellum component FlaF (FlaF/FlaG flagellin family)